MEIPHPTFRPLRPEDRESIARAADNLRIWNCVRDHLPHPYTLADADAFIAGSMAQEPPTDFAIDIGGQAAGVIGMVRGSDVQRISAEVGFWLGEEFWGRGFATGVLTEFTRYLFSATDIVHLFATVFSFNHASMRVLEKSGFTPAGVLHRAAIKNGRIVDLHLFEKIKPGI